MSVRFSSKGWPDSYKTALHLSEANPKNGLTHEVPLSGAALEILHNTARREGREFVFGEGRGGFSGWSKSKTRLDARIAKAGILVRPWRLHDLRRTAATRMAEMGTLPHVIEAVLNHISGHRAGVAGIYNRATYAREKREALDLWSKYIAGLTTETAWVQSKDRRS
jgi:integrase